MYLSQWYYKNSSAVDYIASTNEKWRISYVRGTYGYVSQITILGGMFVERVSSIRKSTNNEKITFVRHVSSNVMCDSENCAIKLLRLYVWYSSNSKTFSLFSVNSKLVRFQFRIFRNFGDLEINTSVKTIF